MTIVKICGITNLEDAVVAINAGADMLGFICYPKSPRYLASDQIAGILSQLALPPNMRTVGVFVDESLESVAATLSEVGLSLAQLHGSEPPEMLQRLEGRSFRALRPQSLSAAESAVAIYADLGPDAGPDLLVDAYHPEAYGGTGIRADWRIGAALAQQCRLMLAGGLNASNVAEAIQTVQPWGVDVSSGVERSPGCKDHAAVRAFIQNARQN